MYQSDAWQKPRRLVIVRQKISERPKATGKQLKLFLEEEIYKNYRYSAYVTNTKHAPAEAWRLYRSRADAENRIKELKYDFGFDSFNLDSFYATEAALITSWLYLGNPPTKYICKTWQKVLKSLAIVGKVY